MNEKILLIGMYFETSLDSDMLSIFTTGFSFVDETAFHWTDFYTEEKNKPKYLPIFF